MSLLEIKIRLPGTVTLITIYSQHEITGQELLNMISEQYQLSDPSERKIVICPTFKTPGKIIEKQEYIHLNSEEDTLELWKNPFLVNISLPISPGTNIQMNLREIAIDYSAPLTSLVPVFQRVFRLFTEEFCFKYLDPNHDQRNLLIFIYLFYLVIWLNANKSLIEQHFQPEGYLIAYPVSHFLKNFSLQSINIEKEGYLFKKSLKLDKIFNEKSIISVPFKSKLSSNKENYTNAKKRYFILTDSLLIYFKTKEDLKPSKIIPLEYFQVIIQTKRSKKENTNEVSLIIKAYHTDYSANLKGEFILSAEKIKGSVVDNRSEIIKDWYQILKKKCVDLGNKQVFGVDIKELMARYKTPNASPIPDFISKAVNYLDLYGLECEGIFRKSGSASLVEYYKDQFDQGVDVDLMKCSDPHTVASLLKLYLRMLPEPLLTFELYDEFLESHSKVLEKQQKVEKLLTLINQLPEENQIILKFLCSFLSRIVEFSDINKMTKENLGTVFGPNLLRRREELDMARFIQDNAIINDITQTMIEEYQLMFQNVNNQYNTMRQLKKKTPPQPPPKPLFPKNFKLPTESKDIPSRSSTDNFNDLLIKKDSADFIKEGFLVKKSMKKMSSFNSSYLKKALWKEKFCRCTKTSLLIYDSNKDKNPKKSIFLKNCTIGNSTEKQYCFVITQSFEVHYFCASNSSDLSEWMGLIKAIINRINETDIRDEEKKIDNFNKEKKEIIENNYSSNQNNISQINNPSNQNNINNPSNQNNINNPSNQNNINNPSNQNNINQINNPSSQNNNSSLNKNNSSLNQNNNFIPPSNHKNLSSIPEKKVQLPNPRASLPMFLSNQINMKNQEENQYQKLEQKVSQLAEIVLKQRNHIKQLENQIQELKKQFQQFQQFQMKDYKPS